MKKSFLFLLITLFSFTATLGQCEGDIVLATQADVDAFPTNYGCTEITGNLLIGIQLFQEDDTTNIVDLSPLGSITSITENLTIMATILTNLEGLNNLQSVGGFLTILSNPLLENLQGLNNISEVGSLSLSHFGCCAVGENYITMLNSSLQNLDGLESLTSIQRFLFIGDNPILEDISALQNITYIGEGFDLCRHPLLEAVNFESLEYLGGGITICSSENLKELSFGNLQNNRLDGFVRIREVNFPVLYGLENIDTITGALIIENTGLLTLDGIGNNLVIENDLGIGGNHSLISLDFENILEVEGEINILNNPSLNICCSMAGVLADFTGDLTLENNGPMCNEAETFLYSCDFVEIQTQVFYDEDNDGVFDANEQYLIQDLALNPNALLAYGDGEGINHFYLNEFGNYELTLEDNSLWSFNDDFVPITINYLDSNFQDTMVYLPLFPSQEIAIQSVDLTSGITRCNMPVNYWLTYNNEGTVATDGMITLNIDESTTLISADPPVDSTSNNQLFWFYENLFPTYSNQIDLIFEMPSVDFIGEIISFEVGIQTNEGLGDAKKALSSELICAYDPNDKLVTPMGLTEDAFTLFEDTLEYTVRFQNTGNDTAFNIIIQDILSEHLDLSTFRSIASSHNMNAQINLDTRLATFTFNDIYLPDSFVNEPGSNGFLKYQILAKDDLFELASVENTAAIYFDFNPPIVTNTVRNSMVSTWPTFELLNINPVLNFGFVGLDANSPTEQILVVENPFDLDFVIDGFAFLDPVFGTLTENVLIPANSTIEVPFYFNPIEEGTYNSWMQLQSGEWELDVRLNGTAVNNVGLSNVPDFEVLLFPNPNDGYFNVKTTNTKIESICIQNSLGGIIWQENINARHTQIDLSKESKGLYFISLKTAEGFFVEKIIIQ